MAERSDAAAVLLPVGNTAAAPRPVAAAAVRRRTVVIFALAIAVLFALNMLHAYGLGFQSRMYDSPIYRWRESLVIALSRMQPQPSHGYVGYGSILKYLTQHGLALIPGEAAPLPSAADLSALSADGPRVDRLMQDASRVPIDPGLAPVILQGNELGFVDYMYWSFKLYGISINSLVLFYFTLLLVSAVLFFVTFRQSPFCLLLLMLYLAAHYFALDYAQTRPIIALHNSRFFPVLAILPSLYLILLMAMRIRPTFLVLTMAVVQAFILMFMVFCRTQTFWEVFAILLVPVVVTGLRPIRRVLLRPAEWARGAGLMLYQAWPAVLVVVAVVVLSAYGHYAPDESLYSRESKAHLFWHDFFVATISADPKLTAIYGYHEAVFSDDMGYVAALHDLRGRNDGASPIALESNGVLNIDIWKSNGAYDNEMKRLYLRVAREHPWLVLRSFAIGKPLAQIDFFRITPELWKLRSYVVPLLLAVAASLLALVLGAPTLTRRHLYTGSLVLVVVLACSTMTSFFYPTALIAEVITVWLMTLMLCLIHVPLSWLAVAVRATRRAGD